MRPEACLLVPALVAAAEPSPVALACDVEGTVTLRTAGLPRPLARHAWLAKGAELQTGPGAKVLLVFKGGERWALEAHGRAVVTETGLRVLAGRATPLGTVPMIPSMATTRMAELGGRPGGVTVRGFPRSAPPFATLHPGEGGAVLASEPALEAVPRNPADRLRIELRTADGQRLHTCEPATHRVEVPARLLQPGTWYVWRVSRVDRVSEEPLQATFRTVRAEHAAVRERLRVQVQSDPGLKGLLEAMDRWLGLEAVL